MNTQPKVSIIVAASSGIGKELTRHKCLKGEKVIGTYRSRNEFYGDDFNDLIKVKLDINNEGSINNFINLLKNKKYFWDELIVCSGILNPIGNFDEINFDEWIKSFNVNFLAQAKVIHKLLNLRNPTDSLVVVFAAGGGKVNPTFSAYNIAKVSLTKFIEYLDKEIKNSRFCSIGPGWVDTKIHKQVLLSKTADQRIIEETQRRITNNQFVKIEKILTFFDIS